MTPNPIQISAPLVRAPLAIASTSTLATEYKRKLRGFPWWKQIIFEATRKWLWFCDTKLHLPVIIHHDKKGDFSIDYCGTFDTRELALAAIGKMREERIAAGETESTFHWNDLPHNGVTPAKSGRYMDQGFVGDDSLRFERSNRTVNCPFNGSLCTPDETVSRHEVNDIARQSTAVLEQARNLKRSQT